MIESKSVAVSLKDLRNSGAISTCTFLLKNEESSPHVGITDSVTSQKQMLNATKISLLLARAFAKYNLGVHSSEDIPDLDAGDILLHLGYSLQLPAPNNNAVSLSAEHLDPLLPAEGNEEDDLSLHFISEFFDLDNPLPSNSQNSLHPNTITCFPSQQGSPCQPGRMHANTTKTPVLEQPSFHDIIRTDMFDRVLTLISIDISLPGKIASDDSSTMPQRVLGDLIHFIFSGSVTRLTSTLYWYQLQNIGESIKGRASKRSNARESLFSALLGTGLMPISICRLLTDLINCKAPIGSEERGNTLPISVQDTIQDLEHMCVYPQIYLFNPETTFHTTNLLFGQRLYGRKNELTQLLDITARLDRCSPSDGIDCILISGVGGSGKSHFVNNVAPFLSNIGWIVSSASCGRDMAHRSSATVLSLLDTLIKNIVAIHESEDKSAKGLLSNVLDSTTLLSLSIYLPSLRCILNETDDMKSTNNRSELSQIQLTFLIPRLMSAILSLNHRIVLFLDNFEHVDSSALALLNEMLTAVGRLPSGRRNFLFIGCYRDGIDESHPLTSQLVEFRRSQDICLTEMKLGKLSIDDVTDIIMTELRLPRRHVLGLANIVHKKTSGHALFVVQLLNSLVRDSVLAYSPMKRRFDWNSAEVLSLKTAESVATWIVSNLSSFTPGELASLRALSCFGMEVKLSVISLLQDTCPYGGLELYLPSLIEGGVVEMKESLVTFAHDLIQQGVYNNIPLEERRRLHLHIGRTLAAKVSLDQHSMMGHLEEIDFHRLSFEPAGEKTESQALNAIIGIASNQVNRVDPAFIDRLDRIRFARWNMVAASKFSKGFNSGASAHYCRKGIGLLYDCLWCEETRDLCRSLHEGAASALLFVGDVSDAQKYATALIANLPFADSLCAQNIMLRSLEQMGKYEEQVTRGVAVLRGLNLDIPSEPSPSCIIDAMAHTSDIASKYTIDQITTLRRGEVDTQKKNVLLCLDTIFAGAFRSSSLFFPLITCAVVNYSLQNGVYEESALSFGIYGYFKIALLGDFVGGRYWANATAKILEQSGTNSVGTRAAIVTQTFLLCYFISIQEVTSNLLSINKTAAAMGDVENAIYSMFFSLRCSFYNGENLSLLLKSYCELLRTMKRYKEIAKVALIDVVMIESLVGTKSDAFDLFEGTIPTENFILADAQAHRNIVSIELVHTRRFCTAFWFGHYKEANELYDVISSLPCHKLPKLWCIASQCYRGIIAFQLYREGEGEEWFDEGTKIMKRFELLNKQSSKSFESKCYLLSAEFQASNCEVRNAKILFDASINSANSCGSMNDLGLAYECYGKYLLSIVERKAALACFRSAHVCYLQWGALALAEHVWNKYDLGNCNEDSLRLNVSHKHSRSW